MFAALAAAMLVGALLCTVLGSVSIAPVFAALAAAMLVGALLCTVLGSVSIAPGKVAEILMGGGSGAERNILTQIRLPRMCMTVLLGGALAVSGYLLQTFFGNPIAGPYVLGISSGAKLAVCAALLFVAGGERQSSGLLMILAAFAGALVTTGAILLLSHRVRHMASLLAAGIMVGYICNAVTDFLVTFAEDAQIVNLHFFRNGLGRCGGRSGDRNSRDGTHCAVQQTDRSL